jgi:hypothetical protein
MVKDITLYTPLWGHDRYLSRTKKQTTRKQLVALVNKYGSEFVAVVDDQPSQLLRAETWPLDRIEIIDELELRDGMKLAVLVEGPIAPLDKLLARAADVEFLETLVSAVYRALCL